MDKTRGSFTIPGESGHEEWTLELARRWGADTIRDCEGTALSLALTNAGMDIYSTLCIIRGHNAWAREHMECLQQSFLCGKPVVCAGESLSIPVLESFYSGQFMVNDSPEALEYWEVWDRTANEKLPRERWNYDKNNQCVHIQGRAWRKYTVSFLAYRIWEEINMYNHVTNGWNTEKLMPVDPMREEARAYLRGYFKNWLAEREQTRVVRFTSLFYNFTWIWGSEERNRSLFTDWASYDFTVSPLALKLFRERFGYSITAEDFVNKGLYNSTHYPPSQAKRDWMSFINDFTVDFARELVELAHAEGKLAFIFYDDSWVGSEPNNGNFAKMGFDGIIKCVFSGFEVRLCANANARVHELRLHPYLFPVGLNGAPTFQPGGTPHLDALRYWVNVRRALLWTPIDRIGLGGYPSLTRAFPAFVDCVTHIADEFRAIKALHEHGTPELYEPEIAVLHAWGDLRAWTLSGHFHETDGHTLVHVLESLSGLPFKVRFISFDDISRGVPDGIALIINAGKRGTAWSGGTLWNDGVIDAVTEWTHNGGVFVGIDEPAFLLGYDTALRVSHILGMDIDDGRRASHGVMSYEVQTPGFITKDAALPPKDGVYLTQTGTEVWLAEHSPTLTCNKFGQGKGLYLSGFSVNAANTRLLNDLFVRALGLAQLSCRSSNPLAECACFRESGKVAVINNSGEPVKTELQMKGGTLRLELKPYELITLDRK